MIPQNQLNKEIKMAGLELSNTIVKHSVAKTYSLYLSGGIYDDTQKEFLNDLHIITEHPTNAIIKLFINSPGGYVHIMNEIIYCIQEYSKKGGCLELYITGQACSAAIVIFTKLLPLACKYDINPNSTIMIHTSFSGMFGKASDIKDYGNHLDKSEMIKCFKNILPKKLYEKAAKRDKDVWLTGKKFMSYLKKATEKGHLPKLD